MPQRSIRLRLVIASGLVGLLAVAPGARTGSAQNVNDMVRKLNNVLNPGDAQRLEDQAHRNGRLQEEHYWHDYRAGLESRDYERRDYREPYRRDEGFQGDSGYRRDYRDQRDYRYDRR
jgi:hypothetical protein